MMSIRREVEKENDLTVFVVDGRVQYDEMFTYLDNYSPAEDRTSRNLFDMTNASWSHIPNYKFTEGVRAAKKYSRPGVKTAFVLGRNVDYGMGRILESVSEIEGYVSTIRAFNRIDDAREWLLGTD